MSRSVEHELLLHTTALRRLAQSLVGEQHADDLVQDTALVALQTPPRRPGPLGGWLAGIARHLALHHHRRERRRRAREAQKARPEALPPDSTLEDRDTLRHLSEAMLCLPEPYQGVLLRRYLRERTPQQIASETGVPLATVKSQLQRGLLLLRERLEQRGGDWRAGLCLLFGIERALPVATAAAITTTGVLLMGSGVKLAITAAAAVLTVGAGWWCVRGEAPAAPPAAVGAAQQPSPVAAAVPDAAAPPTESDAAPIGRIEAPAANALVAGATATLRGRCVDADGAAVAGVTATLRSSSLNEARMTDWLRHHARPEPVDLSATTDLDGTFAFHFAPPPPFCFGLELRAAGLATMTGFWDEFPIDAAVDLGNVSMLPSVHVRGVVVDGDGTPVAQERLHLAREDGNQDLVQPFSGASGMTGDDGSFELAAMVAAGAWSIGVGDREVEKGAKARFDAPTADLRIVVRTLDPAATIRGVVVDEAGAPIADVEVHGSVGLRTKGQRTDAQGRFAIHRREGDPDSMQLRADKVGFEVLEREAVHWGSNDLRLQLRATRGQTVHVVRADDGTPVEDYSLYVARLPEPARPTSNRDGGLRSSGRHASGRAVLELQRGSYMVVVEPEDDRLAISALVPLAVDAQGAGMAVVRLSPRIGRVVRLQARDGSPVAGARAQLCVPPTTPQAGLTARFPLPQWSTQSSWPFFAIQLDEGMTNARGEVRLHGACDGRFTLQLPGPGHAPQTLQDVRLDGEGPLAITVATGATLRGRCMPMEAIADLRHLAGMDRSGKQEQHWRPVPEVQLRRDHGAEYYPSTQEPPVAVAADGTFVIDHAPPGAWRLQVIVTLARGDDRTGFGVDVDVDTIALREGETTEVQVDLSPFRIGQIDAVVLNNGVPLADARLTPVPIAAPLIVDIRTSSKSDAEGRLRCERMQGPYRLEWAPAAGVMRFDEGLRADETIVVTPGQSTRQTFHFRTGTLRLHVLDAAGAPVAGVPVELRDAAGERRHTLPATDKNGIAEMLVEAETFTCKTLPAALLDPEAQRALWRADPGNQDPLAPSLLMLGTVTARQGATTEIELRLPADYRR